MKRKLRGIATITLTLLLVMTMVFSGVGTLGMLGNSSFAVLGSDGGKVGSDGDKEEPGGGNEEPGGGKEEPGSGNEDSGGKTGSDGAKTDNKTDNTECDPYDISCATVSVANAVYTGKALKPKVTVKTGGKTLVADKDYTVTYTGNTNAGSKAKAVVKGLSPYYSSKTANFTIAKAKNTMTAKGRTVSLKHSKLKSKTQTISAGKAFTISKAKGKVTYKKKSGNSKITVSSSGKIKVKKGLKKGSYKVKVNVKAAGGSNYKAVTKTVTVTVKVK